MLNYQFLLLIKSILNYKRPVFWICIVSVILIFAIALGFMLDPSENRENSAFTLYHGYKEGVLISHIKSEDSELDLENIYMTSDYKLYTKDENGADLPIGKMKMTDVKDVPGISELSGGYCVAAWKITKNSYSLTHIALMNDNQILAVYRDNDMDDYKIYSMSPNLYSGTLNPETSKADFFGIIIKIEDDYIVVCPGVGGEVGGLDEYIQLGGMVKLNTRLCSNLPKLNVGDQIEIEYDGNPKKEDMPYIENVYSISILEIK